MKEAGLPHATGKLSPHSSLWIRGAGQKDSLESPLGKASVAQGSQSCSERVSWCAVCCSHRSSLLSNTPWSSPYSHLLQWLSRKLHRQGDLRADWQTRSGLQCSVDFAGQIKVLGRISLAHGLYFWHTCCRKVLVVVRRTNVSLYFTI